MFIPRPRLIITLGVIALLCAASRALGQSDSDLRRENQRLQTRVKDLQRELEAAQRRIADLERQIEQLRRGPARSRPARPTPPGISAPSQEGEVTIDESVPNASPRALLTALQESYQEATGSLDIGTADTVPASGEVRRDRKRIAYLRALDRWAHRVNRELKSQITWHVRLVRVVQRGLEMQAVDPKTLAVLGDPFPVTLPASQFRRLEQFEQRGKLDVLQLKGVLVPSVRVNPQRPDPGPFDKPRFIGPFAELGLSVQASSVTAVVEKDETKGRG
ncbi:MAG: hypothetical protein ACYS0G_05960 [Planctomycetota bacterium]|jgi:hypothetical protein